MISPFDNMFSQVMKIQPNRFNSAGGTGNAFKNGSYTIQLYARKDSDTPCVIKPQFFAVEAQSNHNLANAATTYVYYELNKVATSGLYCSSPNNLLRFKTQINNAHAECTLVNVFYTWFDSETIWELPTHRLYLYTDIHDPPTNPFMTCRFDYYIIEEWPINKLYIPAKPNLY